MIWALLALLGVPLWLCAIGILMIVYRNRELRHRAGNLPVRRHLSGKRRWSRGHAVWVGDVFAFRGSPAAWQESLLAPTMLSMRLPTDDERAKLRRLDAPVLMSIIDDEGVTVDFAASSNATSALVGPFASTTPLPDTSLTATRSSE